jgi:spoIIIJ-associated protein
MEWVEITADTIDAARDLALDRLGVMASEIEVEVVTAPTSSMFGLRKTPARIRARIRPTAPAPKVERNDRRARQAAKRAEGGERAGQPERKSKTKAKPKSDNKTENETDRPKARRDAQGTAAREVAATRLAASGQGAERATKTSRTTSEPTAGTSAAEAPSAPTRRRTRKVTNQGDPTVAVTTDPSFVQNADNASTAEPGAGADSSVQRRTRKLSHDLPKKETHTMNEETPIEEQGAMVVEFLDGLVQAFGLNGSAAVVSTDDDVIDVAISGTGLGVLIGPGGHTMSSLGEVAKTALQRQMGGNSRNRVRVDVAGYRAVRRDALIAFTNEVAEKVRATGAPHAFEPMNPADRKIVHDTATDLDGVGSTSDGEEPRRRVVLIPA